MLEERSAKHFLEEFLPRWRPDLEFICIAHEGKTDLEKSLPRKLKAWQFPDDLLVVLRDNDGTPCLETKARLSSICLDCGRQNSLVRLACQELESWFLGDLRAVEKAFGLNGLERLQAKQKFREPDRLESPSRELQKIAPTYQKLRGSRLVGQHLGVTSENNRSRSFQVFLTGLERLL
jgi:hypothetical protein